MEEFEADFDDFTDLEDDDYKTCVDDSMRLAANDSIGCISQLDEEKATTSCPSSVSFGEIEKTDGFLTISSSLS